MINVPENELFSAYLDGELTVEEQADVEQLLVTSPAAQQLMDELRALSAGLQSLPEQRVGEDLSDRVLREAERRILSDHPDLRPRVAGKNGRPGRQSVFRRFFRLRNFFWSALAVGVALLLMLRDQEPPPGARVAVAPPPAAAPQRPLSIQAREEPAPAQPADAGTPVPKEGATVGTGPDDQSVPAVDKAAPMLETPSPPTTSPVVPEKPSPLKPKAPASAVAASQTPAGDELASPEAEMTPPVVRENAAGPAAADVAAQPPAAAQPEKSAPSPEALAGEAKTPATEKRPAKEAEAAAPAEEPEGRKPKPEILIVYCDVTSEVLEGKVFDQILAKQKITPVDAGASQEPEAGTSVFRVEVTPQQIAAVMQQLKSRPDEFRSVKPEANREIATATAHVGGQIVAPRAGGNRATFRVGSAAPADGGMGGGMTVGASPSTASPRINAPKTIGGSGIRLKIGVGSTAGSARKAKTSTAEDKGKSDAKAAKPKPKKQQPQTFGVRFVLRASEPKAADSTTSPADDLQ